jgi:hypothetical protein
MVTHISKTTRGKPMLIHEGYEYCKNGKSIDGLRLYWLCVNRNSCKEGMTTNLVIHFVSEHSHMPDQSKSDVRQVTNQIRLNASSNPNLPPALIVETELHNIDPTSNEIFLQLSEKNSLVRMLNRFQNQARPNLPFNVQSCIIVPPYTTILIGEPFYVMIRVQQIQIKF